MAQQTAFLVEHYLPGRSAEHLQALAVRVSEIACVLHATIVPGEESLLCVIEAQSEDAVRSAYAQAGVEFDRISPTLAKGAEE